jgi:hypothetical protein
MEDVNSIFLALEGSHRVTAAVILEELLNEALLCWAMHKAIRLGRRILRSFEKEQLIISKFFNEFEQMSDASKKLHINWKVSKDGHAWLSVSKTVASRATFVSFKYVRNVEVKAMSRGSKYKGSHLVHSVNSSTRALCLIA